MNRSINGASVVIIDMLDHRYRFSFFMMNRSINGASVVIINMLDHRYRFSFFMTNCYFSCDIYVTNIPTYALENTNYLHKLMPLKSNNICLG